ncbi:MAG: hypothetical protein ACI38V_05230 [Bacteroides sp.]
MDYIDAFKNLKTNSKYSRKSPHKAILLLTIMELIEKKIIITNEIKYDDQLKETFMQVWNRTLPNESLFIAEPYYPFWYMQKEEFWHIFPVRGKEYILDMMRDVSCKPTERKIENCVKYAELDPDLYFLMTMSYGRTKLKRALLETYTSLSDDLIERLSSSENSNEDNSQQTIEVHSQSINEVKANTIVESAPDTLKLAFSQLDEDVQITLCIEYYSFLKTNKYERESIKEICPTVYDLYDKIIHPLKQETVNDQVRFIYEDFLKDLRIHLMSEDGALELIDQIQTAIDCLNETKVITEQEPLFQFDEDLEQSLLTIGHAESLDKSDQPDSISEEPQDSTNIGDERPVFELESFTSSEQCEEEFSCPEEEYLLTKDSSSPTDYDANYKKKENDCIVNIDPENKTSSIQKIDQLETQFNGDNRKGKPWTENEEELITLFFNLGKDYETIANAVGRTVVAIKARLGSLGLIDYKYGDDNENCEPTPDIMIDNGGSNEDYKIENTGSYCSILNKQGEKTFSDFGKLITIREKIYRLNLKKNYFTVKEVVNKDNKWQKSTKLIVAYSSSPLFSCLNFNFLDKQIEDIDGQDTMQSYKIKVNGSWYDCYGFQTKNTCSIKKEPDSPVEEHINKSFELKGRLREIKDYISSSYDILWLMSVVDCLFDNKTVTTFSFDQVACKMISNAWTILNRKVQLKCKEKQLVECINYLVEESEKTMEHSLNWDSDKDEIYSAIIDFPMGEFFESTVDTLTAKSPIQILKLWFKDLSEDAIMFQSQTFANSCLYAIRLKKRDYYIEINSNWCNYLYNNHNELINLFTDIYIKFLNKKKDDSNFRKDCKPISMISEPSCHYSEGSKTKLYPLKSLPIYRKALNSDLILGVLNQLRLPNNIFEITNLNVLQIVYEETTKKEVAQGRHRTNASAVKKLMEYIENGLTYKDFLYDANLVENQN